MEEEKACVESRSKCWDRNRLAGVWINDFAAILALKSSNINSSHLTRSLSKFTPINNSCTL